MKKKLSFLLIFFQLFYVQAQNNSFIEIKFSKNVLEIGEDFMISVEVHNPPSNATPVFPEIKGMLKGQMTTSQQKTVYNGKYSSSYSYLQRYQTVQAGVFSLKPFTIKIGQLSSSNNGMQIKVNAPQGFEDDNFLEYRVSKSSVSIGESVHLELNMWYETSMSNDLQFSSNAGTQLEQIKKDIKSKGISVEEMPKSDLQQRTIHGKNYSGSRIIDYIITPQQAGDMDFGGAELNLTKKIRTSNGMAKLLDKMYESNRVKINVLPLPNTTQKAIIGDYAIKYEIEKNKFKTGEESNVTITITGEGNLPYLIEPRRITNDSLIIVQNDENLELDLSDGTIKGNKKFVYSIIPQIPGNYDLSRYFGWHCYNFKNKTFKDLEINEVLEVNGENLFKTAQVINSNGEAKSNSLPVIQISAENNLLRSINSSEGFNIVANLLLLLILAALIYLLVQSRKRKEENN